jgi:hypothetical protein
MEGLGLVKEQVYVTGIRIVSRLRAEEALDRLGWRHGSLLACLVWGVLALDGASCIRDTVFVRLRDVYCKN